MIVYLRTFFAHILAPCEEENSPDGCCSTYPNMPSHGENDLGNPVNNLFTYKYVMDNFFAI